MSTKLEEIIIEKIKDTGPISFHDFMEMALYYPVLGYYTSPKEKLGADGDYYTSPVLSNLFGHMIGRQLEEMWNLMDKSPLTIVEYGAGSGILCFDILNYLKYNEALYRHLKYFIIEKSAGMQKEQQKLLDEKVEWINSIDEIEGIKGCVISNEVVDNFAVDRIVMKDELLEVFVDYRNQFVEKLVPASEKVKQYLQQHCITLPKEYCAEVNLEVEKWIKEIALNLERGFIITVDYGYPAYELYAPERKKGTLTCYYKHRVNFCPYVNIGQQDITAHVNFSALHSWGQNYGLQLAGFCSQNYFLRSLGIADALRELEKDKTANTFNIGFQVNTLLGKMGNKFKVLIQQKGIESKVLWGMQIGLSKI
jgi:SAM-dependent MidA family methyltransferase